MRTKAKIIRAFIYLSAAITFLALIMIIADILIKGLPFLKPSMFALKYTSKNLSMTPAIINTLIMVSLSLLIAVPFGIVTSIYLNEYAKTGNKLVGPVRLTTQTLSGIPSIVYGLFGFIFFVTYLKWKYSLMAGSLTLSIMILPIVITSTEEALKSVPMSLREASYGLGAMKLRTIFRVVLPPAMPGILSGIVLSVGRIVGETAAIIYTAGSNAKIPRDLFSSGRTLATHMYILSTEGLHKNQAYAAGVVLILVVLLINYLSGRLAGKIARENSNE